MKKLLVVRARGLSADQAVRGDRAWNVSDLIADGSFAPFSASPDLDAAVAGLAKDRVTIVDLPYKDAATFDGELGKLRAAASDAVGEASRVSLPGLPIPASGRRNPSLP